MSSGHRIFLIVVLFISFDLSAATYYSRITGNWNTAATWSTVGCAGVAAASAPGIGDDVIICNGNTITMDGNAGNCLSLTIQGTATWTQARVTNVGSGGLVMNGGTISGTATGTLNVAGSFIVPLGTSATIGRSTISVSGTTTIDGSLVFNNMPGTKTFSDITINSAGVWNCSVAESFIISGNLSCSGTFTSNTGTYTFSGTGKNFSGIFSISNISVLGTYTNNGALTAGTTLSGTGTLTQGAGFTLNIRGSSTITNLIATATPNTVNYNGSANQTIKVTTYRDLLVSSTGGTVTFGSITVNNNFTIAAGTVSIGGATMRVTGATSISGRLNINSTTGTKTFNDLTINSGGTWNSAVAEAFTINGNISNSGTFTANNGVYTLAGTVKTIAGTLTVPTFSVTGSYTNNGTLTSSTALRGAGTFSQGAAGILNIGATAANFSVTTLNASTPGNTVNYNRAGAQNVRVPSDGSYHHLTLSGSGNKTLPGVTDINGNISISSILVANNFNMTLAGNWSNTGTFTPGTNTVTLDGSTQSITKSGGEIFNHLVLSGSATKTLGSAITTSGNLTINSTLDVSSSNFGVRVNGNWINNGIFIYRTGTVTFSGGFAQTIGGTVTTDFYNLTQSNAAGVSLTHDQNLIRVLTISAGTLTTTGYNFTLISNASGTASIAAIPAGANFAGNIIMQRYSGTGPTDWRFLASPVTGTTIADWADDFATSGFTGSTDPGNSFVSIYSYDETQTGDLNTYGYVAADNVTNSISNGKGFWVYLGPTPVTFEVMGSPNKFNQPLPVTYVNSGNITNDGWNLVINPYASAIDWNSANWVKTNLDNAIYIYNSNTGSYASYVAGSPFGVNGGSNVIPSSQSFWVKANAASPVLTAVENTKTSSDAVFMKTAAGPNTSSYPMAFNDFSIPQNTNAAINSIRLTTGRNGKEDETYIQFKDGASNNFDGQYDAWKLQNLSAELPNVSSVINDTSDLSINSMSSLTTDVAIKIRLTVRSPGTYSIRRDSVLMLPMSACVFLEDKLTGIMTDFRANISYSFTISDTTTTPRFILHIYAPISKTALQTNCSNDSSGMAIAKGTGTGPWNYVWKNSLGAVMKTTANSSMADTLFNLPVGIYTVEVSGSVCGIVSDTIAITSSSTLQMSVNYSNVTCHGLNNGAAYATTSGGNPPYTYLWNNSSTTSSITDLAAGNYSVWAIDAGGCSQTESILVSQPGVLIAAFMANTDTVDLSFSNSVMFTDTSSGALTYNWNFGDSTLADTARNPIHYYSGSGSYSVMLVVSNGTCLDTSYANILVLDSTSTNTEVLEQAKNNSVHVAYENGEVFLVFDLLFSKDVSIGVYNILGDRIQEQKVKEVMQNKIRLYKADFSPGVYIAVINMDNAVISEKIVFQGN